VRRKIVGCLAWCLLIYEYMTTRKLCLAALLGGMAAIATAQPADAAPPGPYPVSDGHVGNDIFPQTGRGAQAAKATVRNRCGDAFCTIQIKPNREYVVWFLSGCDTFRLNQFKGRFLAHNGGSLTVDLLNSSRRPIYRLWGGSKTTVNWDRVYYIRTCNRS
jgi:hypothetical protein